LGGGAAAYLALARLSVMPSLGVAGLAYFFLRLGCAAERVPAFNPTKKSARHQSCFSKNPAVTSHALGIVDF